MIVYNKETTQQASACSFILAQINKDWTVRST